MRLFATAALLAGLIASPASAQFTSKTHNTNTSGFRVFNTGYFGNNIGLPAFADTTFIFNGAGAGALYEGQLIVALSPTQFSGDPYSDGGADGASPGSGIEWSFGPTPAAIAPPAPFTQAYQTSYDDSGTANTSPVGINVVQRSYSRTGDDFVIVELNVSTPLPRSNVYIGMFADFDISASAVTDRGNFDATTRTVYAYNAAVTNSTYYGVSLLGRQQSGWSATALPLTAATSEQSDAALYQAMTANGAVPGVTNGDRRLMVAAGPFTFAPGVPQQIRFAYVAGTNLADLVANATVAQGLFSVAAGETAANAEGLALRAPQPNPSAVSTELAYTLDAAQDVRLAVYDVLGREVTVVARGARGAGTHTETVDVSRLPSGVYTARLVAGTQSVLRRFTVAR